MIWLLWLAYVLLVISLVTDLILVTAFLIGKDKLKIVEKESPISILVAARNEEQNIKRCLDSLENLDSSPEQTELIVGDDASTDRTLEILRDFKSDRHRYQVMSIGESLGSASGKGNVVAHLTKQANEDVFCITDADMILPPTWLQALAGYLTPTTGICCGVTSVSGTDLKSKLQNIEWLIAQGMIKVSALFNLPVTALGNNMAITRVA